MSFIYDVIIVGAGPAGMAAAIYAKRARLSVIVIEKNGMPGGQITQTYEIDNYPGLSGVSGVELSEEFRKHCDKLDVKFVSDEVVGVNFDQGIIKQVFGEEETYEGRCVVLAGGARYAKLKVPGESELAGAGVSYCATCDGAFFRGRTVAVIGGGDVAVEDAIYLARSCEKVYLIHRRNELRAASILQEALFSLPNVEILWDSVVEEINGDGFVESVVIKDVQSQELKNMAVDGVFIAVGILPNSNEFTGHVAVNDKGYIIAGENCETNIPGVFAAGDIRTKQLRQVVTAVADGANAITSAERYLLENR